MSFADIVHKSWQSNHLFSALVELTYRCNLDCYFCYNDLSLRGRPLSRRQYFDLFDGLRRLGTFNLILSGGEPLAHPDFFELGRRARDLGFVVRIKSNGHALDRDVARRIRDEIAPFVIETSLHGATAESHDRQTRVPGSFDRLMSNLVAAGDLGLRLQVNTTLTAWNEHELHAMVELVERLGLRMQIDPEVTPRDDGDSEPLSIRASREAVAELFRLRERRRAAATDVDVAREGDDLLPSSQGSRKHCGAGSATVAVDPFGSVYPCVQWRSAVGNLHRQTIEEIWTTSSDLRAVRRTTETVKEMLDEQGAAGAAMAFCPGNAAAQTGDPLGIYPAAAARRGVARDAADRPSALLPIVD